MTFSPYNTNAFQNNLKNKSFKKVTLTYCSYVSCLPRQT